MSIAIGQEMFLGSDNGGRSLAIQDSFTVTCKLFGINPWTCLLLVIPPDQLNTLFPSK